MYGFLIVLFLVSFVFDIIDMLSRNMTIFDGFLGTVMAVQVVVIIALLVNGIALSEKRKRIRERNEDLYVPDAYAYYVAFWYSIFCGVIYVLSGLCERMAIGEEYIMWVIVNTIITFFVVVLVARYFNGKYNELSRFDEASPLYTPFVPTKKEEQDAPHDGCIPLYRNILSVEDAKDNVLALVINPAGDATTFCVKSPDDSMEGFGIQIGSIVYFKESENVLVGDIVAAIIGNQILIRRITKLEDGKISLEASNNAFPPMVFENANQIQLMGVASAVFKKFPDQSEEA